MMIEEEEEELARVRRSERGGEGDWRKRGWMAMEQGAAWRPG